MSSTERHQLRQYGQVPSHRVMAELSGDLDRRDAAFPGHGMFRAAFLDPLPRSEKAFHRNSAQKRWMRWQASSNSAVEVAYEMRRFGPSPKAEPCTAATPSVSSSSETKSASVSIVLPDGAVRPIAPAQEG